MTSAEAFWVLRFVLAGLLGWSALSKVGRFDTFTRGLATYKLIPVGLVSATASVVVGGEILASVLLLTGNAIAVAAGLAGLMFTVFAAALGASMISGRDISCHCFGVDDGEKVTWIAVSRSIVLGIAALALTLNASAAASGITIDKLPALLTIVSGLIVLARYASSLQAAWRALRSPPGHGVRPTERVTFMHLSRDASLFGDGGAAIRHSISGLDPTARETGVPT